MAADCNSADFSHNRFDPYHFHHNVPFSQRLGVTHMTRSGMTFRRVVPVDQTGVSNTIVLSGREADRRLRPLNKRRREEAFRSDSISVSIPPCHGGETGSIPVRTAKFFCP